MASGGPSWGSVISAGMKMFTGGGHVAAPVAVEDRPRGLNKRARGDASSDDDDDEDGGNDRQGFLADHDLADRDNFPKRACSHTLVGVARTGTIGRTRSMVCTRRACMCWMDTTVMRACPHNQVCSRVGPLDRSRSTAWVR